MNIAVLFDWLVTFFDDQFLKIMLATALLFLLVFFTWWLYRIISRRNIFVLFHTSKSKPHPDAWDHILYVLKYFFLFPLLTFAGFIVFAFSLFILMKPALAADQQNVLFIAIVVVSTIRVSAYVNENLAEDLAKLIPLSMIAIILTHPNFETIGLSTEQVTGFFMLIPGFLKYLVFTIMLEALLRGGTWLARNINVDVPNDSLE
jgi:hypothetical protein